MHARLWRTLVLIQGNTSGQTLDVVDVHALLSHHVRYTGYLLGGQFASQDGDDITILALHADPLAVFRLADRAETDIDIQFIALEQQLFQDVTRVLFRALKQDAQRELVVYVRLTDV